MKISATISWSVVRNGLALTAALLFGMVLHVDAQALTINVVDPNGNPVTDFRWLVEEDATKDVDFTPAQPGSRSSSGRSRVLSRVPPMKKAKSQCMR